MNIVTEQICEAYMKLLSGEKIEVKAGHSYIEYLEHEQKYLLLSTFPIFACYRVGNGQYQRVEDRQNEFTLWREKLRGHFALGLVASRAE